MKKIYKNPSAWIALFLVLCGAILFAWRSRGPQVPCARATRRDLEQHLVASGRVMPPARVSIAAQSGGLVLAVTADEGQHVKQGELLIQLDDGESRAQVAQAKAAVSQASAKVEQLKRVGAIVASQGLIQTQSQLDSAAAELERNLKLAQSQAVSPVQLEESKRAVDVARAKHIAAQAQQLGTLGADSRLALSVLLQSQAQLTGAQVRLAQTRIYAPHDGVVLSRTVEVGDVVQPARTLLVIASDGEVELVFQADERNLAALAIGQKAKASADAFPQNVFEATVDRIAPSIDPQRGTVEIDLRVPRAPLFLIPDMTVSIDLLVAERKNALVLPKETVRGITSDQPWVLTVEAGHAAKRPVHLGIRGDGDVEISSGLEEGTLAVIPDGQIIAAGQRVRTVTVER